MEQNQSNHPSPVNILLVDDHPANLLALEGVLESLGHNLIRANSGEEALKWLLKNDCAVILLDVQMPVMDGYETAGLIQEREQSQHIPIIFVTAANNDETSMLQGYAAGAVDYIIKPFGADILKAKVSIFVKLFQRNEEVKRLSLEGQEKKRLLAESQAYLSEFKSTLDATLDGVFMLDAQSLHFSYVNYGGVGQLGYEREEILTLTPFDFLPEADAAILREKLTELRDGTLSSYTFQTQQRRKDGSHVPVEVFMQFVAPERGAGRFVAVARDITEHKLAQQALKRAHDELETHVAKRTAELQRANCALQEKEVEQQLVMDTLAQSEERFRLLVERVHDYAIFMMDSTGHIMTWNAGAQGMKGYRAEEIIGHHFSCFYTAEDQQAGKPEAELDIAATQGYHDEEGWRVRQDGSQFWATVVVTALRDDSGHLRGFAKVVRDITERKNVEAALREAKLQADSANLAKSEFLSRMSHELRTPLNAILGFGQILDSGDLTPRQHEGMGHILKGGHHLIGLINEVLDIARVEAGHSELTLEPVSLNHVVSECCALLRPIADQRSIRLIDQVSAGGEMNCRLKNESPHVMVDRQRLKQVVINLLSNAIKYNHVAGEVTISLCEVADERIRLQVQDDGAGLSSEDVEKLFTPFERLGAANSQIEGTGLGLVISQRLISAMGGTVGVESSVGQGSTFWIELPQVPCPVNTLTEASAPPQAEAHSPAERTFTVLSIEDNLSNIRLMEVILESRPEIVLQGAMQGSVGLDLARQYHPDVILLDLNLPGLSGIEVLEQLQQSADTREIPVIVISADATAKQIERLLGAGAIAYFIKPFDVNEFLTTIDEVLHRNNAIKEQFSSIFEIEPPKSLLIH